MTRWARAALLLSAIGCAVVPFPGRAAAEQTARQVIEETADQVLAVLRDKRLDSDAKVARIEEIANQRFDFETISRLVLAQTWRKLSDAQKREFVEQFRKHLSVTYGRNVDRYTDQEVRITGDRAEPRGDWTVQTQIFGRDTPDEILVDYRLRKADGTWKVIDVVVERVSLISNFRSQLRELVSSRGVEGTLEVLREKNAAGESILPEEQQTPGSSSGRDRAE